MSMTTYTGNTAIIAGLGTTPEERGLTDDQFKAKFDEGLTAVVAWINTTHKTEFELIQTTLATTQTNLTTTDGNATTALNTANLALPKDFALPSVNLTYIGETSSEAMAASCAVTDLLYLSATGYNKAKGDSATTIPCVAMCVETGTGTRKVFRRGFIKNTSWAFTVGNKLYVSAATAGLITATQPATTGNQVQIVGYAVATDTIYFNPQYVYVEV